MLGINGFIVAWIRLGILSILFWVNHPSICSLRLEGQCLQVAWFCVMLRRKWKQWLGSIFYVILRVLLIICSCALEAFCVCLWCVLAGKCCSMVFRFGLRGEIICQRIEARFAGISWMLCGQRSWLLDWRSSVRMKNPPPLPRSLLHAVVASACSGALCLQPLSRFPRAGRVTRMFMDPSYLFV